MELRDKHCLYQIKDKFGGSVKLRAGDNHLRYRLHHKAGLLKLIDCVNGLIRNPTRILQPPSPHLLIHTNPSTTSDK